MKFNQSKWRMALMASVVILGAVIYFRQSLHDLLAWALDWIATLGIWGPVIFTVIYIAACVLFIPGSVLTLGAGALFGVVRGFILVSIASTLGATAAFLVGRYLARAWVAKKIEGHPKFSAI